MTGQSGGQAGGAETILEPLIITRVCAGQNIISLPGLSWPWSPPLVHLSLGPGPPSDRQVHADGPPALSNQHSGPSHLPSGET